MIHLLDTKSQDSKGRIGKYSVIISYLAELNNEFLMKNYESRPSGSTAIPEANAVTNKSNNGQDNDRGHGSEYHSQRRGRCCGHGSHNGGYKNFPLKRKSDEKKKKIYTKRNKNHYDKRCYRCGVPGHYSRNYRTPKYLVDFYHKSLISNGMNFETDIAKENSIFEFGSSSGINNDLNVADFIIDLNERI